MRFGNPWIVSALDSRLLPNQKNWFADLDPDTGSRFFDSIQRYFYTKG